ncbi:SpoIIE family protein phosphatase [Nonomuraea sp. NPDC046802]|uniref:SpoIIE family protein phosphatase n=1 Tax=Nonomuraea sp. NPDC046802 TaxID=3154919 RepID=UPI0033DB64A8
MPWHGAKLDEVLLRSVRDTGAHIGVVFLKDEAEPVLIMDAVVGLPAQIIRPWTRIQLETGTPAAASVRHRQLIWVPNHHDLVRRFPATALATPYSFAMVAAPIMAGYHARGSLVLIWPESRPDELAAHEREAIAHACHDMGTVLQQAPPDTQPSGPTGHLRVLVPEPAPAPERHPDPAVSGYLDRLRVGGLSLDLLGRITFVSDTAAAFLGGDMAELLGRSLWEVADWLEDPLVEDRCRAALMTGLPSSCSARSPEGHTVELHLYPEPSGLTLRITPLEADRLTPWHTHELVEGRGGLPRAHASFNFLQLAAALTRALNVDEIIDLVADHVLPVFKAKAMAILITEGGRMRLTGSRGYDQDLLDRFDGLPITSRTPAEDVARTGEPEFFADWEELNEHYPQAVHYDRMAAWAFLPLAVHDEVIGACVLAFHERHPFGPEERAALTALAGLVAHALDRAVRYDTKDQLAHSLQKALLPRSLPDIPGLDVAACYVPATRGLGIGGDFYDLIRLTETSAAAVIGDVQGHNVTAAALMGQVRTAIHANAVAGANPGEVLKHTNRLLIDVDTELFTSCLLIYVDLQLRTLRAASAGHPPPLLRPPNMPAETIDVPTGLLLGIDPDAEYPTLQVPFPPEALLALYTDGLVEAPGVDLDHGIANLAGQLPRTSEDLQRLGGKLLDHVPHASQHADDIALLLLEHRAKPA